LQSRFRVAETRIQRLADQSFLGQCQFTEMSPLLVWS
jgi:hypothetical protein